jgi:hypothetical protein
MQNVFSSSKRISSFLKLKFLHFFLFLTHMIHLPLSIWDPIRIRIHNTPIICDFFFPDGLFFVAASSACRGWRVSRLSQPAVWLPRTRDDRSPSLAVPGAWDSSPAAVHRFLLLFKETTGRPDVTGLHRWIGLGYDSVADP